MFGTKALSGHLVNRAGRSAYNTSIQASKAAKIGVGKADALAQDAMKTAMIMRQKSATSTARKIVYGGGSIAAASAATAMRPNANQSRTAYRGPGPIMQAPPGSGRYA